MGKGVGKGNVSILWMIYRLGEASEAPVKDRSLVLIPEYMGLVLSADHVVSEYCCRA